MTDKEFAAACAAMRRVASMNSLALRHEPYGTSREDIEAVVRMAESLRFKHRAEADRIERA